MTTNAKDYLSAAQQFFTSYDAHDVDGMLALCADGALGRMLRTAARASCQSAVASIYLARVSECRSELPSQSDRANPCRGET